MKECHIKNFKKSEEKNTYREFKNLRKDYLKRKYNDTKGYNDFLVILFKKNFKTLNCNANYITAENFLTLYKRCCFVMKFDPLSVISNFRETFSFPLSKDNLREIKN